MAAKIPDPDIYTGVEDVEVPLVLSFSRITNDFISKDISD